MADVTYKVEFELSESVSSEEKKEVKSPEPKESDKIGRQQKGLLDGKILRRFMIGYGIYKMGANVVQTQRFNEATFRGDNLAAIKQKERSERIDSVMSSAIRIGGGLLITGAKGGMLMLAFTALQIANKSIQMSMENAQRLQELRAERYVATMERERFVRNATTEQLKW